MNTWKQRTGRAVVRALCAGLIAIGTIQSPAHGVPLPPRGSDATPIRLKDLDGAAVNTKDIAPKSLVLVFGELGHDGVRKACADVLDVLTDARIDKDSVATILIVAQEGASAQLKEEASLGRYPPVILRDDHREFFGAYHVLVVPTIVVVDGHGKVTYALPGFLQRFKEILVSAVLTSQGKMTQEQLDQIVDTNGAPKATPEEVRAARLVHLGRELMRHGLLDTAAERFAEAISIAPEDVDAKQGLGELLLKQGKFTDAMGMFRAILAKVPGSPSGSLGLAEARLGLATDADITEAASLVQGVIKKDAKNARAHYLLGRVLQAQGKNDAATGEYRRAAELLLELQANP